MVNVPNRHTVLNTTSASSIAAESDLKICIQAQTKVFEDAVRTIERLENAATQRELGSPDSVAQLQRSLEAVVAAQQKVSAAHSRFTQTSATLTDDMRTALSRHEDLLRVLIGRIDHLQKTFEGVRFELIPQLDVESRRRNMHAAYQKSLKSI